jgi:3-hydroxyisobutyrate dehydrogenase-like beta-hydroxyacid dehydrogenase
MVSDPGALADVTEPIAAGVRAGAVVVQMSTVSREAVERVAAALPAGVGLLDAPVLGSLPEAEAGELRIFVGGDEALLEHVRPVLEVLGTPVHVGPLGAGTAAKLVANSILFGVLGVLGESLWLARLLGLPDETAFDVLAATPLAAQTERRRPAIEADEYPTRFALSLALKDAELVAEAGRAVGADIRLLEEARRWLEEAEAAGLGDEDYSAVLAQILGTRV